MAICTVHLLLSRTGEGVRRVVCSRARDAPSPFLDVRKRHSMQQLLEHYHGLTPTSTGLDLEDLGRTYFSDHLEKLLLNILSIYHDICTLFVP